MVWPWLLGGGQRRESDTLVEKLGGLCIGPREGEHRLIASCKFQVLVE